MKPFNLERALAGDPVVTRDGQKVQRVVHLPEVSDKDYCVIAVIDGAIHVFDEHGMNLPGGGIATKDLFMASCKRTVWVNLYEVSATHYDSEEKANKNAGVKRIGGRCWPLEIDE
jgi:hypothetical protein